jgi:lysophospholipase L1-like esterase
MKINARKFIQSLVFAIMAATFASCSSPQRPIRESDFPTPIRVACIGDSITFGHRIADPEHNSYPAQLAALLGRNWQVRNFGVNGAAALKHSTRPYNEQPAFRDALLFNPNVVVILLGANDTNEKNWAPHKAEFFSDYRELVGKFQNLATKPRIYLCRPVPLFRDRGKSYDTDKILTEEIIPQINEVARQKHLPIIDLYAELQDHSVLFPDGVHPNATGAHLMAQKVYQSLTGKTSPKSL